MRNLKKLTKRTAAWIMAAMMVLTTVNLPVNAIVSNAEEDLVIETEVVTEENEENSSEETDLFVEDVENSEEETEVEETEESSEALDENEASEETDSEIKETVEDSETEEETEEEGIVSDEETELDENAELEEDAEDEAQAEEEINKTKTEVFKSNNVEWYVENNILYIGGYGDWVADTVVGMQAGCPPWCQEEYMDNVMHAVVTLSGATKMNNMFYKFEQLNGVDFYGVDTSNVTSFYDMFAFCQCLTLVDFSTFNTSNLETTSCMFYDCSALVELDLSSFDTSKVTDMTQMFASCNGLKKIDLSNWDTSSCTNMSSMFSGCRNLEELDVSSFDTSNVANINAFIRDCASLKSIDLSSFSFKNVTAQILYFFDGDAELQLIKAPYNCSVSLNLPNLETYSWYTSKFEKTETTIKNLDYSEAYARGDDDILDDYQIVANECSFSENGIWGYVFEEEKCVYNGKAIKPEVRVYDGVKLLTKGTDYTLSYKNNINVAERTDNKAPSVIITGKGNYKKVKKTLTFTISPAKITDYIVDANKVIYLVANGKEQKPVKSFKGIKVTEKDYDIVYYKLDASGTPMVSDPLKSLKDKGRYTVYMYGKGKLTGQANFGVEISDKKPLSKVKITVSKVTKGSNGEFVLGDLVVKDGKKVLVKGTDYSVESYDMAAERQYALQKGETVSFVARIKAYKESDYFGEKEFTFTYAANSMSKVKITGIPKTVTYSGLEKKITDNDFNSISLEYNAAKLERDKDYKVEMTNNVNVGTATIKFIGINDFTGTVKKTYKITPMDMYTGIQFGNVRASVSSIEYYMKGGTTTEISLTNMQIFNNVDGASGDLIEGKDYTVKYKNNNKVSPDKTPNATYIIKGKGNYKGAYDGNFRVTYKDISMTTASAPDVKFVNKAGNYKSKITLTDVNGKKLTAKTDYDAELKYYYGSNTFNDKGERIKSVGDKIEKNDIVPVGTTVIVKVNGKGNYNKQATVVYRVSQGNLSSAKVTVKSKNYTGNKIILTKDDITVKVGSTELVYGKDYVLTGYTNNVNKGKASVTVKGIGNYGGSKKANFTIKEKAFNWLFALND